MVSVAAIAAFGDDRVGAAGRVRGLDGLGPSFLGLLQLGLAHWALALRSGAKPHLGLAHRGSGLRDLFTCLGRHLGGGPGPGDGLVGGGLPGRELVTAELLACRRQGFPPRSSHSRRKG